jgi:hypothetical protein
MAADPGTPAPVPMTASDGDLTTVLIVAGVTVVLALFAFGLARLARLLPRRIPRSVLAIVCAAALPTALLIGGFVAFADGQSAGEWIVSRQPRAYRNVAILYAASLLGAWLGLRERKNKLDLSTFD